jgi:hypothetical protein
MTRNITKYFVSRPSPCRTVTDLLDAPSDFLAPCLIGTFIGNISETRQQLFSVLTMETAGEAREKDPASIGTSNELAVWFEHLCSQMWRAVSVS